MNGHLSRNGALLLLLALLPLSGLALWQEDYQDPTAFGTQSRIVTADGDTFVRVTPGQAPAYVYRHPIAIPPSHCDRAEFAFAVRFATADKPLQLLLTGTGEAEASILVRVALMPAGSTVQLFTRTDEMPSAPLAAAALAPGHWHRLVVRSHGQTLTLEQEEQGQRRRLWQTAMPAGLHSVALLSAGGVDLRALALTALPPPPVAEPVDPLGLRRSSAPFTQSLRVPPGHSVRLWGQVGPAGLKLTLGGSAGAAQELNLRLFDETLTERDYLAPDPKATKTRVLPQAGIAVDGLHQLRLYVRPQPTCYTGPHRQDVIRTWSSSPAASTHRLQVVLHPAPTGVACWLDGRYAGGLPLPGGLRDLAVEVPVGSAAAVAQSFPAPDHRRFLPLEIACMNRPGVLSGAEIRFAGTAEPPFVPPTAAHAWLGAVKEMSTPTDLVEDAYLARSAFDGYRESCHFSVPSAQYSRAWLLCAVDEDPAHEPVLSARLTRYSRAGRGDAIADSTIDLPRGGAAPDPRVRQVGTVLANGRELPLWQVELELHSGDIEDLIFKDTNAVLGIGPYLDFELLGRLDTVRKRPNRDVRFKPLASSTSAVHVFAVTLERTPVEFEARPAQPGNVFHGDEVPEFPIALRPQAAGEFVLAWTVTDVTGTRVDGAERPLRFAVPAGEQIERIPLRQAQTGWYGIDIALRTAAGRTLLTHNAAFALLPPDHRQSGLESPYGTWWFSWHYGTLDPTLAGPLMLKAGFRKSQHGIIHTELTEKDLAPWKLTAYNVDWIRGRHDPTDEAKTAAFIRGSLERFPSVETILVFHESRWPSEVAPELLGQAPRRAPDAERQAELEARWRQANAVAKVVKEQFPQLKTVVGNTVASSELPAELFRRGLPAEYVDYIGYEAQAALCIPERLNPGNVQGSWLLREAGRRLGYDRPLSCSFEGVYRTERMLGPQRLAEWYVRDGLLMHAYGFRELSIALLYDVGNCYWSTMWGSSGLCRRNPQFYPRPAYVALATLTRVLDQTARPRQIPTGSHSVYALEFARRDGRLAYALWASRGEADLTLDFPQPGPVEVLDLYGRGGPRDGQGLALTLGTAPQYVLADTAVRALALGARRYPADAPPADLRVLVTMDDAAAWQVEPATDVRLERRDALSMPYRTRGRFARRGVEDAEQGRCLELELLPQGDLPEIVHEYAVVRLASPVAVPGTPASLGMLVKGNSGWGRVLWELQDANGMRFLSTSNYDGDVYDQPGTVSLNFDGWNFLRFPLTEKSSCDRILVDALATQWVVGDNQTLGTAGLAYPVQLTGFAVEVPRCIPALTEMTPVTQRLRFKSLSVFD